MGDRRMVAAGALLADTIAATAAQQVAARRGTVPAKWGWGAVSTTDPLTVLLDHDTDPVPAEHLGSVPAVGTRVHTVLVAGRVIILAAAASGGGSGLTTQDVQVSAGMTSLTLPGVWTLTSATFTQAGRVRLYRSEAGRAADSSRTAGTDYPGGRGLLYDYVATTAGETDLEVPVPLVGAAGVVWANTDHGCVLHLAGSAEPIN